MSGAVVFLSAIRFDDVEMELEAMVYNLKVAEVFLGAIGNAEED